jgi:hypothetical protein
MTWKTVSLTALLVGGLALVLSVIPRLPPKWKRLLDEMVLPLLFVSLTIDAVRDQDHFRVMFVIACWAFMAGLYMKSLTLTKTGGPSARLFGHVWSRRSCHFEPFSCCEICCDSAVKSCQILSTGV